MKIRHLFRQLLEKCGPQQVGVIRIPVPFGPKKVQERRNFLLPVYRLIRYHRLTFESIADGALRWTFLPWIESITHFKAGEEEELEIRVQIYRNSGRSDVAPLEPLAPIRPSICLPKTPSWQI